MTTWNMSVQITLANILKQCKTHLKHIPVFSVALLLVELTKSVAILIQVAADVCLHKQTNSYKKIFHLKGGPGQLSWYSDSLTGWTVRGSNPGGVEIIRTSPGRPSGPPSLLYNGYRVFPWGKAAGTWRWPPIPSSAEVKERGEPYLYSPYGPSCSVLGWPLPLPLVHLKDSHVAILSSQLFQM
jgi:hypothetical protein